MKYFSNTWVFLLSFSSATNKLLAFIFFVAVARVLSAEDYGVFRYLIALSSFFFIPLSGVPFALTRYVSKNVASSDSAAKYLFNSVILGSVIIFPIFLVAVYLIEDALILNLLIMAMAIDAFYIAIVNAFLAYPKMALYKIITNLFQLILLYIFFNLEQLNLFFVFMIFSFSGIMSIVLLELMFKRVVFIFKYSFKKVIELLKFSIPASAGAIGWTLLFGINAIWIEYFDSVEDFAFFSAGETFAQMFLIVPTVFASILLPKTAALSSKNETQKPLYYTISITSIVSLILIVPFIFYPQEIIQFSFGVKYEKTSEVLIPLILSMIFISFHTLYAQVMFAFNRTDLPMYSMLIGSIINSVLGFFLTREFGIYGTSCSLLISCFLSLTTIAIIYHFLFLRKTKNG